MLVACGRLHRQTCTRRPGRSQADAAGVGIDAPYVAELVRLPIDLRHNLYTAGYRVVTTSAGGCSAADVALRSGLGTTAATAIAARRHVKLPAMPTAP
jgi:membrane carboxypeptidase/penicillin-binding protein